MHVTFGISWFIGLYDSLAPASHPALLEFLRKRIRQSHLYELNIHWGITSCVFRMCLQRTKAMLKWNVFCLLHTLCYKWNSAKIKLACGMYETFAYLYFNDLFVHHWKKLNRTFMVTSPTCAHRKKVTHVLRHTHILSMITNKDTHHPIWLTAERLWI